MIIPCHLPKSHWTGIGEFRNFLRVGRCLHAIALVSFMMLITGFFHAYNAIESSRHFEGMLFLILSWSAFTIPIFAELDAYSRYQNYKMIRDLIWRFGFRKMIISKFRHSKCQREAAFFAASEMGFRKEIRIYFQESGYRWYHVFPDFLCSQPEILFSRNFWLATFFTKTYIPKHTISNGGYLCYS